LIAYKNMYIIFIHVFLMDFLNVSLESSFRSKSVITLGNMKYVSNESRLYKRFVT